MKKIFVLNDVGEELEADVNQRFGVEYQTRDENGDIEVQHFYVTDDKVKEIVNYIKTNYKGARVLVE